MTMSTARVTAVSAINEEPRDNVRDVEAGTGVEPLVLEMKDVTHGYRDVPVLRGVSLQARRGEFLTLLGPSGSGKTTLLKIIAGLEEPEQVAALSIDGRDVTGVPPNHRDVVTVFQHYALFPNMTVGENVEYGLRVRRVLAPERRRRAIDALHMVRLGSYYDRWVHQLSGGERQRVALARALVLRPVLVLLDEPLGALDEKLRQEMQLELIQLHRALAMTFVYVTHSQEEALTMSDRIVLLNDGRIAQQGTPRELYERPTNRFVAAFLGIENIVEGNVTSVNGDVVALDCFERRVIGTWSGAIPSRTGQRAVMAVRAQSVAVTADASEVPPGANSVPYRAFSLVYKGRYLDRLIDTPVGRLTLRSWTDNNQETQGFAWWHAADCVITPMAGESDESNSAKD